MLSVGIAAVVTTHGIDVVQDAVDFEVAEPKVRVESTHASLVPQALARFGLTRTRFPDGPGDRLKPEPRSSELKGQKGNLSYEALWKAG